MRLRFSDHFAFPLHWNENPLSSGHQRWKATWWCPFMNSSLVILFVRTLPEGTGFNVTVIAWYLTPSESLSSRKSIVRSNSLYEGFQLKASSASIQLRPVVYVS